MMRRSSAAMISLHQRILLACVIAVATAGMIGTGLHRASAGSPPAPPWANVVGDATNLSETPGRSQSPVIASNGQGGMVVAWRDNTTSESDIWATFTTNSGATWSIPENLSDDVDASLAPVAWATANTFGVAWLTPLPASASGPISFATTTGGAWTPGVGNITASAQIGAITARTSAADRSNVIVNYTASGSFFTVGSLDGGMTWGEPQVAPALFHSVAVDGGGEIWAAVADDQGAVTVWHGEAHTVNDKLEIEYVLEETFDNVNADVATVASDGADGIVVYWRTNDVPREFYETHRPNRQADWSEPQQVNRPGHAAGGMQFAASENFRAFVFEEFDQATDRSQIFGSFSNDGGETFEAAFGITPQNVDASDVELVLAGDIATILYEESLGAGASEVRVSILDIEPPPPSDGPVVDRPFALPQSHSEGLTDVILASTTLIQNRDVAQAQGGSAYYPYALLFAVSPPEVNEEDDVWMVPVGSAGDGNCDGVTDGVDGVGIVAALAGFAPDPCAGLTNVDCDDEVGDAADLLLILRGAADLPIGVPSQCNTIAD